MRGKYGVLWTKSWWCEGVSPQTRGGVGGGSDCSGEALSCCSSGSNPAVGSAILQQWCLRRQFGVATGERDPCSRSMAGEQIPSRLITKNRIDRHDTRTVEEVRAALLSSQESPASQSSAHCRTFFSLSLSPGIFSHQSSFSQPYLIPSSPYLSPSISVCPSSSSHHPALHADGGGIS